MSRPTQGRRERKKAATRDAIANAALQLFFQHGYDHVSIADVAEAADVSRTALFKHFPSKEALVFDEDHDREATLLRVVQQRPPGQGLLQALHRHFEDALQQQGQGGMTAYVQLIDHTPALVEYSRRMWTRHEESLAHAIAREVHAPADDPSCRALARFVLESPQLARGQPHPQQALSAIFALLEQGWTHREAGPSTPKGEH